MSKFDTYAQTTYYVRLAGDARTYEREDKEGEDVVITFMDSSRVNNTEDLWVDARVARFQADRAKLLKKGDEVQVEGKLRFKLDREGKMRGKMYDVTFKTFAKLSDRVTVTEPVTEANMVNTPVFGD